MWRKRGVGGAGQVRGRWERMRKRKEEMKEAKEEEEVENIA